MTAFSIVSAIVSLLILAAFIVLSVKRFGWRLSYSKYAKCWDEAVHIHNVNLWSAVTIVAAILLCFGTIEAGSGSNLQFLGFMAPVYLAVVAFTPRYEGREDDDEADKRISRNQRITHYVGTAICAVTALLWLILTLDSRWWLPIASFSAAAAAAVCTKTVRKSYVFWLEMAMFAAVYAAVFMGGLS